MKCWMDFFLKRIYKIDFLAKSIYVKATQSRLLLYVLVFSIIYNDNSSNTLHNTVSLTVAITMCLQLLAIISCRCGTCRCSRVWPCLTVEGHHSSWGRSQPAQGCCSDADQLLISILKVLINLKRVIHPVRMDGESHLLVQALDDWRSLITGPVLPGRC